MPTAEARTPVVAGGFDLDEELAGRVLGDGGEHLRALGALVSCELSAEGPAVRLRGHGAEVQRAKRALRELQSRARRGMEITPAGVRHAVELVTAEGGPPAGPAAAPAILTHRGTVVRPRTAGQREYVDAMADHTIVLGVGPAGTGKTYLAMAKAVQALREKRVNRIVLSRPVVEAGEKLGFLPGTLGEKIDPYLRPLHDALHHMMEPAAAVKLLETGVIEVAPLAYMRGRTLDDAFVILDEAQNTTPEQMKMFLTRLGFGSTMVVTGDLTQIDLPGARRSGLGEACRVLRDVPDIAIAHLGPGDVVRHALVGRIIAAYDEEEERREHRGA